MAIVDILVGDVFDRDFTDLFADVRRMLPLGETAVGQSV